MSVNEVSNPGTEIAKLGQEEQEERGWEKWMLPVGIVLFVFVLIAMERGVE